MLRNRFPESPPATGEWSAKIRSKIRHPLLFSPSNPALAMILRSQSEATSLDEPELPLCDQQA